MKKLKPIKLPKVYISKQEALRHCILMFMFAFMLGGICAILQFNL